MNTPRSLRSFFVRGLLAASLSVTSAFAISPQEINALRAKAEAGNGVAQYNLGLIYAAINDPTSDPVEAYVWFNLAADNGATGRALVLLNSQLNSDQIAEGKRRLEIRRAELAARRNPNSSAPAVSTPTAIPESSASASPIGAPPPLIAAAPSNDEISAAPEVKKLSTEVTDAWKENDDLKARLERATQQANEAGNLKKERDQLAGKVAALTEDVAKLRSASSANTADSNLSAQLATTNNKLKAAEAQLAEAMASINELNTTKQNLNAAQEQAQKLTAENQRLNGVAAQSATMGAAQAATERELSSLRSQLAQAQAQLSEGHAKSSAAANTKKELDETQVKLDSAMRSYALQQAEIDRLQKALTQVDVEREGVAKQLADARAATPKADPAVERQVAQLTADLAAARSSHGQTETLQKALSDAKAQLSSAQENFSRASQEKADLVQQLESAKSTPAAPSTELTRLKTELGDVRGRLAASEQALARSREDRQRAIEETVQASNQQLAQVRAELETEKKERSAVESEAFKTRQERDAARQEALNAGASNKEASDVAALRAQLKSSEDAVASANSANASLTEQLAAANAKVSVSLPSAPTFNASSSEPAEDAAALHQQVKDIQGKLEVSLRSYQLKQDEVDRLQKSVADMESERTQLNERLQNATTQVGQATSQASANQDAAQQLSIAHEQARQAQNEIASLATENLQLKNRISLLSQPSTFAASAPRRPATASSQSTPLRPVAATPTPTPVTRTHTIADGDTLTKISRRYYGSSEKWAQILEANRGVIRDPNNLTVGATLRIP